MAGAMRASSGVVGESRSAGGKADSTSARGGDGKQLQAEPRAVYAAAPVWAKTGPGKADPVRSRAPRWGDAAPRRRAHPCGASSAAAPLPRPRQPCPRPPELGWSPSVALAGGEASPGGLRTTMVRMDN